MGAWSSCLDPFAHNSQSPEKKQKHQPNVFTNSSLSANQSKMTKSDVSYTSVPVAEPYVEGFTVGSSHAVTVIVDENDPRRSPQSSPYYTPEVDAMLHGSRKPIELVMCPHCNQTQVRTRTKTYPSVVTWCGVVVSAAIFFPLCWIPLVCDPMKQTDHFCQNCGKKIGTVKALQGCFVKEQT